MGLQFLLEGVGRGERVLYLALSETAEETQLAAEAHGWSLDGVVVHEMPAVRAADAPDEGNTIFHHAEVELGETIGEIREQVRRHKPDRVVVDSLSELRLLAGDSIRFRRQMLGLKRFMNSQQCTALLLDDCKGEGELTINSLAHGVMHMALNTPEFGGDRRQIRVVKMRGFDFAAGFHDFAVRRGGVVVFPRLIAADYRTIGKPSMATTGLEGLDTMLGGGLQAGTCTLLMGTAGTGKSTVGLRCAVAAAERGERAAVYVFDERPQTMYQRCTSLGIDLERHVDAGLIQLQQVDPAELTPGEFAHLVRRAVDEQAVKLLLIDSLAGYLNAMSADRYLMLQMHELLAYLGQRDVTTLMVHSQAGLLSHVNGAVHISYLADNVLLFVLCEVDGQLRQAVSALKNRSGDHGRAFRRLEMEDGCLRVGERLSGYGGLLAHSLEPAMSRDANAAE
jgi:circadian clock protein KaiC